MKTILFPTDFSTHADNALIYAIKLAEKTNSQLVVFYSTFIPDAFAPKEQKKIVEKDELYKQTMLESLVAELCKKNKVQVPENIIYEAKNGNSIVKNILTVAKKHKADLIIVGTHGTTGLKKILFGSTTSGLILQSQTPVLVIPIGFKYIEIKNIVYASDMKKFSKELSALLPIANALNAHMEVLFLDYWKEGKKRQLQFEQIIAKKSLTDISFVIKPVTIEKSMSEHIKNHMRKHDDSILSMFPEDTGFLEKIFFKSITEKISTGLHKPLLSIKK